MKILNAFTHGTAKGNSHIRKMVELLSYIICVESIAVPASILRILEILRKP